MKRMMVLGIGIVVLLAGLAMLSFSPVFATQAGTHQASGYEGIIKEEGGGTRDSMQPDFVKVALNYTSKHVHIKSGRPQVLLSQQVTYAELNDLGLSVGNYGPTCTQPQQLVILRGDFDMRDAAPMSLAPSVVVPAAYIAYVYDIRTGDQVSIQWDRDGSHFKKALNDPSLPDLKALPSDSGNRDIPSTPVAPVAPAPVTPYLACTPQVAPGWATPPSTP